MGPRRNGIEVIDLSAGRSAEHTPGFIREAASRAMDDGMTHQTPSRVTAEFLTSCAQRLKRENGLAVDPETQILAT